MTDSAQNSKQILAQKGTAGTPGHSFLGGNTTGMYLAGTNQLGFSTAGTFAAVIDASGNVGIGTASPSTKTVINLSGGTSSYTNPLRLVNIAGGSSGCDIQFAGTYSTTAPDNAFTAGSIGGLTTSGLSNGSGALIFKTQLNGTLSETMRIDASGNVGIGTSSPVAQLSLTLAAVVTGDGSYFGGGAYFSSTWKNSVSSQGGWALRNSGGVFTIWSDVSPGPAGSTLTNMQERVRVDGSGNVGIGTSSPVAKLQISGSTISSNFAFGSTTAAAGQIASDTGYVGARIVFYGSTSGGSGTLDIYAGATAPIQFSTNGAERMRIDGSGNVGIGLSNPAVKADINGVMRAATWSLTGTGVTGGTTAFSAGTVSTDPNWGMYFRAPTGSAGIANYSFRNSADTDLMTIDSSGNVGIGTSSPVTKMNVQNGTLSVQNGTGALPVSGYGWEIYNVSTTVNYLQSYNRTSSAFMDSVYNALSHQFYISGGEAMRLNSNGDLYLGAAGGGVGKFNSLGGSGQAGFFENNGATEIINISNSSNTAFTAMRFLVNAFSTVVGSISCSTSATSFNTSSDYRLKNSVTPMTSGIAAVSALKPVTYKWNADNSNGEGFIAHELAEIIPLAVTGEKDAVDKDGKIKPQGVDYSKVVVHLVAAIQELSAKVAALEGK